jgi:hypothetical protein
VVRSPGALPRARYYKDIEPASSRTGRCSIRRRRPSEPARGLAPGRRRSWAATSRSR